MPRHASYGPFLDAQGRVIDQGLALRFPAPHSYTGEEVLELQAHGGAVVLQLLLARCLEAGATLGLRLAEPGEFTKRAFLGGKMDLVQAEAVAEVIRSRTDAAMRGARNQLDGYLSAHLRKVKEYLISVTGLIELELDFSEEDLEFVEKKGLKDKVSALISETEKLIASFSTGRKIFEGINVAIIGKPNVGKSSLLNLLLKEERAIVSHIPGTTRDVIREELVIDGICFRLFDTAGLRRSADVIEEEGVRRARMLIEEADIVLHITDASADEGGTLQELSLPKEKHTINVLNKADITPKEILDLENIKTT